MNVRGEPLHVDIHKLRVGYSGIPQEGSMEWLVAFWRPTRKGIERKAAKFIEREHAKRARKRAIGRVR